MITVDGPRGHTTGITLTMLSFQVVYSGGSATMGTGGGMAAGFRLKSTENLLKALGDMSPEMEAVRGKFQLMEALWFASRGEGSWAPLADSTLRRKRSEGAPDATLVRSRELLASLTDRSHPDGVQQVTAHSLRFGTRVPYASKHDFGTRHMPARRPIPRRTEHPAMFAFIKDTIAKGLRERALGR